MVNGDILTDLNPNVLKHTKNSALALVPLKSPYGVIELDKNGLVTGFVEKPQINDKWINAGVYFFTSHVFDFLPDHGNIETTDFTHHGRGPKFNGDYIFYVFLEIG